MLAKLNELYHTGTCRTPPPGRYAVEMQFYGQWHQILEKKIRQGKGTNHLPVFALNYFKIALLDFNIHIAKGKVLFKYARIPLEDHLKKISIGQWLGKIYWQGRFVDFFMLTKI